MSKFNCKKGEKICLIFFAVIDSWMTINRIFFHQEIEDLVAEKVVEMLSSRSELGELRRRCDAYKEKDDKWRRKIQALQKMCQDLVKIY